MAQETASPGYMASTYFEYQKRYADRMRENDRVLLGLMDETLRTQNRSGIRLLDIGCSNGNLLKHMRSIAPNIEYWGGEIQPEVIERCRNEPSLAGIRFELMNARDLSPWPQFDVVVANAVLFRFPEPDFEDICASIGRATVSGGRLFTLDFYHRFSQELAIEERSAWHPEGLKLHFRSFASATRIYERQGFRNIEFHPFDIPIDVPPRENPDDIGTYTVRTEKGENMQFRGALYQPWCHLTACKT